MTTLSLKLPPEVAKIMPWIVAAKITGDSKQAAWARKEYKIARERATQRERWEIERQALLREIKEREDQEQERHLRSVEKWQKQRDYWALLGVHFAVEDGWEEIQPCHSSQKGWRRLLSECDDLVDSNRYGKWGRGRGTRWKYSSNRNCGRKPRTLRFKKTRRPL